MQYAFTTLLLLILLTIQIGIAQRRGDLLTQRYAAQTNAVKSSIWSLAQSPDGKLYLGTGDGIIEYDGVHWRKIELSNRADVRSLAIDKEGNIFAGGKGEFGRLTPNPSGKLVYESLLSKITQKEALNFTDVWSTVANSQYLYFLTDERLFILDRQTDSLTIYQSEKKKFFLLFEVDNQVFLYETGKGLFKINGSKLTMFSPAEKIGADVYALLPYDEAHYLVVTRNPQLLLCHRLTGNITYLPTAVEKIFQRIRPYTAVRLPKPLVGKANFLFATYRTGILITDENGEVLEHIEFENYGQENHTTIWSVLVDKYGHVWAGMDGDLGKCELYQAWRKFGEPNGLTSTVRNVFPFQDDIFITTARRGNYHLQGNQFKLLRKTADENHFGQAWKISDFIPENDSANAQILFGTSYGVFRAVRTDKLDKKKMNPAVLPLDSTEKFRLEEVVANRSTYRMLVRQSEPNRIYLGTYSGLTSLRWEKNQFINEGTITDKHGKITELAEDNAGNLWLGTSANGLIRLTLDTARNITQTITYDKETGFDYTYPRLYRIENELVVGTSRGLLHFNTSTEQFEPYNGFGEMFAEGRGRAVEIVSPDGKGNYWISGNDMRNGAPVFLQKTSAGSFQVSDLPFRRLPSMKIEQIFQHPEGSVWVCGSEGLFIYNTRDTFSFAYQPTVSIRKITVGQDSVLYMGASVATGNKPKLSYQFNRIVFEFALPFFTEEQRNEYSYYLEGNDKNWSEWTTETRKEYTNLFEGNYVFKVKARNIYGVETSIATYSVEILPPWFRTPWAYGLYFAALVGSIILTVRAYAGKLKKDNERLEKVVEQRTAEIAHQKEIIEDKNKSITASIRYAERIQKSILPREEILNANFDEHFVLFKPRDIVSGDFYFCAQTNQKVILAVADCTGHGVPGALMSMVGVGLLNQIIFEKNVTDVSEILLSLHKGILNTLQQTENHNQDGMDIALCVWNKATNMLEFAGAKNPLIVVEGDVVSVIKGDILGIGGLSQKERTFVKHAIQPTSAMCFYMSSDGFQDQFGGTDNRKLTSKNFRAQLLVNASLPMSLQKEHLEQFLENWKGTNPQNDDILVMGFRISV